METVQIFQRIQAIIEKGRWAKCSVFSYRLHKTRLVIHHDDCDEVYTFEEGEAGEGFAESHYFTEKYPDTGISIVDRATAFQRAFYNTDQYIQTTP